jgi:hypothetical protein
LLEHTARRTNRFLGSHRSPQQSRLAGAQLISRLTTASRRKTRGLDTSLSPRAHFSAMKGNVQVWPQERPQCPRPRPRSPRSWSRPTWEVFSGSAVGVGALRGLRPRGALGAALRPGQPRSDDTEHDRCSCNDSLRIALSGTRYLGMIDRVPKSIWKVRNFNVAKSLESWHLLTSSSRKDAQIVGFN